MLTDFHSHILPNMDDGSKSVAESIDMLAMAAAQGIPRVVATPHFVAQQDKPLHFLERRAQAEQALRAEMAKHPNLPEVEVGAEVYYFRGISETEYLPMFTIGDSRCVLIEMPPAPWPETVYEELEAIWVKRNLIAVVAHIDRYIRPFHTCGIPERLEDLPVYVQANAEFFLERKTARMAMRMLKRDQIHILGSDCHNLDDRKPNLDGAVSLIRNKMGEEPLFKIRQYENTLLSL